MVYRKTAKVEAGLSARRTIMIASAIDVISRDGIEALSVISVTERAGVSKGLLYQYFPDMAELRAAVVAELLSGDLAAIGSNPLAASIAVFYGRLSSRHLTSFRLSSPGHYIPMRQKFAGLIGAAVPGLAPKARQEAARASLGAIYGLNALGDGSKANDAQAAVLFVLRALDLPDGRIRAIMRQGYSLEAGE